MIETNILQSVFQHCLSKDERLFQAAKAAMQTLISLTPNNEKDVAVLAVKYANALLGELEHEKGR